MKKLFILASALFIASTAAAQSTCNTAQSIAAGTHTVDTLLGTDVADPICAANGTGATTTEWFTYTPSQDYTVQLSTDLPINIGKDTRFHVYLGTCGALTCHAGDDDSGSGFLSSASFPALQGSTYYIAFDNRWDSEGFDFTLTELPYVPPIVPPISFTAQNLPDVVGKYRICVVDMNGDYLDDIVVVDTTEVNVHYQQTGGGFVESSYTIPQVTFEPTWSLAAGDIDKNGFNDLVFGNGTGVQFMYANATGTGYTEAYTTEYVFSQRSNFVDINNDGHLDAFVCHDVDPNVFYMNDGNNVLSYNQGGMGDHSEGGYYGSIWTDYDNDGDPDLFIAKCRGGQSTAKINELFRNDGNGVFTEVSAAANMDDPVQTWSSAWNDFDNDGDMDVVIGASSNDDGMHKVMRNNGDGTFTDVTSGSGWDSHVNLNIEHISYDFDNDGNCDVYADGYLLFGNGDLTFSPVSYSMGDGPIGDLNDDGFLDIQNGSNVYFNDGNNNNWVKFSLQGVQSNGNGIGSWITIYGDWGTQIREIRSGQGFRNMQTLNAHFGLGQAASIDSVHIQWPSGHVDSFHDPAINQSHTIVEGSSPLGLLQLNQQTFAIYPNPTTQEITIASFEDFKNEKIELISYTGAFIQEITSATTDVSDLPVGRYIVKVTMNNGASYASTFIKK